MGVGRRALSLLRGDVLAFAAGMVVAMAIAQRGFGADAPEAPERRSRPSDC
jgi:hypothetical protein